MASPQEFYSRFAPYAQQVSKRTGLDPRLVLAQAALETGYGKSAPNNNFFGIKSHGKSGGANLQTKEFEGGQMVTKNQNFRGYSDPGQSFNDYADFILQNPRYRPVMEAGGLEGQIAAMGRSGYATDPNYASKLASIANRFDPSAPVNIASDTMNALGMQPQAQEQPMGLLSTVSTQGTAPQEKEKWWNPDRRARLQMGLEGMTLNPNPGIMYAARQGLEERSQGRKEAKLEQKAAERRNDTAAWLATRPGGKAYAEAIMAGGDPKVMLNNYIKEATKPPTDDRTAMAKNYEFLVSKGIPEDQALQMARGGQTIEVNTGAEGNQYGDPPKEMTWARDDQGNIITEQVDLGGGRSGRRPVAIPTRGTAADETASTLETQRINAVNQADQMLSTIDSALDDPALGYATGSNYLLGAVPGTGAKRAATKVDQIKGQVFLQAYERLKGGGVITEIEGQKAEAALARLDRAQRDEDFVEALRELRDVVRTAKKRAELMTNDRESELTDQQLMDLYGGD